VQPDVIHIHKIYPQLSVAPVVVAASRRVPIVQTAQDYEFISANPADDAGHKVDRFSTRLTDRVANTVSYQFRRRFHVPKVTRWIVASEFMGRAYASRGIRAEVLPFFTLSIQSAGRAEEKVFDDRHGLAFAGRLDARKGIPDVVEIARRNPDLPVTIAGMGELEREVRQAAAELKNLEFAGRLDAKGVRDLYAGARVALVPSRWEEPAGLVALEAMLEGTPVVAYASGGLANYVEAISGGVVVSQGDVDRLDEAATQLHADRELWATLSAAGRAGVREFHAPGRYVARLEALYSEAAGARIRPSG
jgi:glycosyltransferase involved in cell wall biosynthesis